MHGNILQWMQHGLKYIWLVQKTGIGLHFYNSSKNTNITYSLLTWQYLYVVAT